MSRVSEFGLGTGGLGLLGGSGVVISRAISPLIWVISIVTLLITLLITSREPPSRMLMAEVSGIMAWA